MSETISLPDNVSQQIKVWNFFTRNPITPTEGNSFLAPWLNLAIWLGVVVVLVKLMKGKR